MAPIFQKDIFKCIFLNEDAWILIKISLMFFSLGKNSSIGSVNGFVRVRRQAIILTNGG